METETEKTVEMDDKKESYRYNVSNFSPEVPMGIDPNLELRMDEKLELVQWFEETRR